MSDCVFCKIVKGELQCKTVYEDDHTLAFLDINPERPGHTIVIPKVHCENIFDCDKDNLMHLMNAVKMVARNLRAGANGAVRVIQNNGKPLQEVFHLHFHVIPY